jgi:hypothetical protein
VVALGREGKRRAQTDARKNPHTAAMVGKLQTEQGKAAYRRRKWIAEPPNGWIKSVLGFRQFSLRGQHHVQAAGSSQCAWRRICGASNTMRARSDSRALVRPKREGRSRAQHHTRLLPYRDSSKT